jgi:hypothetical protein
MLKNVLKTALKETNTQKKIVIKELFLKYVIVGANKKNVTHQLIVNKGNSYEKTSIIPKEYALKKSFVGFSLFLEDYLFKSKNNFKCKFSSPMPKSLYDNTFSISEKFLFILNKSIKSNLFIRVVSTIKRGLLMYCSSGFLFFVSYRQYFLKFCKFTNLKYFDKSAFVKYSIGWTIINRDFINFFVQKLTPSRILLANKKKGIIKKKIFKLTTKF